MKKILLIAASAVMPLILNAQQFQLKRLDNAPKVIVKVKAWLTDIGQEIQVCKMSNDTTDAYVLVFDYSGAIDNPVIRMDSSKGELVPVGSPNSPLVFYLGSTKNEADKSLRQFYGIFHANSKARFEMRSFPDNEKVIVTPVKLVGGQNILITPQYHNAHQVQYSDIRRLVRKFGKYQE